MTVNTDEVQLTGGGNVDLVTLPGGRFPIVQADTAGEILDNVDNTFEGVGTIVGGGLVFVNEDDGVINANVPGQTLTIGSGGSVTNTGLIEGMNGGILSVQGGAVINNDGGQITADGGTVNIDGIINGGTLSSINGGTLESTPVSNGATLNDVTISEGSTYLNPPSTTMQVFGTITNMGTIEINARTGASIFNLNGDTTLTGGGTITMSEAGNNPAIIDLAFQVSGTLDNEDNTIQGAGTIGGGPMPVVNGGVINANAAGQDLILNSNGGAGISNTNLLEATARGILDIETDVENSGPDANITANGGTVMIINSTVEGGTLNSLNSGLLETGLGNAATLTDVIISNGTTYENPNGSTLFTSGTILNGGTIEVIAAVNNSAMALSDDTTFDGGGTIILSSTPGEGTAFIDQAGSDITLTNVNNTIVGVGIIGNNGLQLVNGGTIDANVTPSALTTGILLLNAATQNFNGSTGGTLEATNGGILEIQADVENGLTGSITADGGKVELLTSTYVTGGTLTSTGGGTLGTFSGTVTLDGSTMSGLLPVPVTITPLTTYVGNPGTFTNILGTIANFGTIQINSAGGNDAFLQADDTNVTLTGGGFVQLNSPNASANLFAIIQQAVGGATLTNVNNTIEGAGIIGNNGLNIVNQSNGTILANSPGQKLLFDGGGTVSNSGTLQVNAGSTMLMTNSTLTNFSGNTLTGGTYIINGASGTGNTGLLQIDSLGNNVNGEIAKNAANIVLNGPSADTLFEDANGNFALKPLAANTTATSSFTIEGGYNFTTVGGFANAGTVNIGLGSTLAIGGGGAYTQTGGTTIVAGILDPLAVNINGGTLQGTGTIAGDVTLNGAVIGGGALTGTRSVGTLSISGSLTFGSTTSTMDELLGGTTGSPTGSEIKVTGGVGLGSNALLNLDSLTSYGSVAAGTKITILTATNAVTGTFQTINGDMFDGGTQFWQVLYNSSGDNIVLEAENEVVTPADVTATWSTAAGNWNTATQWSCAPGPSTCVPNNVPGVTVYEAVLDSTAASNVLELDSSRPLTTLNTLTMTQGTLEIDAGATMELANQPGGITDINANSGLILKGSFVEADGTTSALASLASVEGNLTLVGQTLTVTPGSGALMVSGAGSQINLQNGTSLTIVGGLSNSGTIITGNGVSETGSNQLSVGSGGITNSGSITLEAKGDNLQDLGAFTGNAGSQLNFSSANLSLVASSSGTFANNAASQLNFNSGSAFNELTTGAFNNIGGSLSMGGNHDQLNTGAFTNSGTVGVGAVEALTVFSGGFTNDGAVTLTDGNLTVSAGGFSNGTSTALAMLAMNGTTGGVANVTGGFSNGANGTVNLSGMGDLLKADTFTNNGSVVIGPGETLTVSALIGYIQASGTTNVMGALGTSTTPIAVNITGGKFQGTGTVTGNVTTAGGTILGGDAPGALTINGNYSQTAGIFQEMIGPTSNSMVDVNGGVTLSGAADLAITTLAGETLEPTDTFDIVTYLTAGGLDGTFFDAPATGEFTQAGWNWTIDYDVADGVGKDAVVLTAVSPATSTPEPGTLPLLATGLVGLALIAYRKKQKATGSTRPSAT